MTRRRWSVLALGAVLPLGSVAAGSYRAAEKPVPLYADGIAVSGDGSRHLVPVRSAVQYLPGTRVLDLERSSPHARRSALRLARAQRSWLAAGRVPGQYGRWGDLVTASLLDIHALTLPNGASVAGWSARWRYVWPRDASFVAVALAATGHHADAVRVLTFLQSVQGADGTFHARYLPDGSGPPDGRGVQADGPGWALWAVAELVERAPDDRWVYAALQRLRPMIDRSTERLLADARTPTGLPSASSDYWEVDETVLTLGIAASALAGLSSAASLYARAGVRDKSAAARLAADQLAAGIQRHFGPDGYPRHLRGVERDAAITFLLPPFVDRRLAGVDETPDMARTELRRPAGGLAPGAGWKDDGISWTPETALFALTAATTGRQAEAEHWLDWLDSHRTRLGALPEKVLADGSPAGVAPLAWTSALVVLTVAALDVP